MSKKVQAVYFSPSKTTETVVRLIAGELDGTKVFHDILERRMEKKVSVLTDEVLILGMPVFSGRIPEYCLSSIKHLHGNNTPAIIATVYGNRAYEDALIEMEDLLTAQGFKVMAAGAFIAQHSLFTSIAVGRPDDSDKEKIVDFARKCKEKLVGFDAESFESLSLPGNRPYRAYGKTSVAPEADKSCTKCRECVKVCPVGAISSEKVKKSDSKKCIMCTACVYRCPAKARHFSGPAFAMVSKKITGACKERREIETFI